jgi:hypothetical protein
LGKILWDLSCFSSNFHLLIYQLSMDLTYSLYYCCVYSNFLFPSSLLHRWIRIVLLKELFPPFIYLVLFVCVNMSSWIGYNSIFSLIFWHILFQAWPLNDPSVWLLCPFNMTYFFFQSLRFLIQKDILECSYIFSNPARESIISPET